MENGKAKFVHPREIGLDFPINTREELCQVAKALNSSNNHVSKVNQEAQERKVYMQLKEKYGK